MRDSSQIRRNLNRRIMIDEKPCLFRQTFHFGLHVADELARIPIRFSENIPQAPNHYSPECLNFLSFEVGALVHRC